MIISETKQKINNPQDVAKILQDVLKAEHETDQKKEHVWIIGLSAANIIEYIELVHLGTLNNCNIHPREIFRLAVMKSVANIIFVHNHPSEELTPSHADIQTTDTLKEGGKILGINVLDSIIITTDGYYSLQKQGLI